MHDDNYYYEFMLISTCVLSFGANHHLFPDAVVTFESIQLSQ